MTDKNEAIAEVERLREQAKQAQAEIHVLRESFGRYHQTMKDVMRDCDRLLIEFGQKVLQAKRWARVWKKCAKSHTRQEYKLLGCWLDSIAKNARTRRWADIWKRSAKLWRSTAKGVEIGRNAKIDRQAAQITDLLNRRESAGKQARTLFAWIEQAKDALVNARKRVRTTQETTDETLAAIQNSVGFNRIISQYPSKDVVAKQIDDVLRTKPRAALRQQEGAKAALKRVMEDQHYANVMLNEFCLLADLPGSPTRQEYLDWLRNFKEKCYEDAQMVQQEWLSPAEAEGLKRQLAKAESVIKAARTYANRQKTRWALEKDEDASVHEIEIQYIRLDLAKHGLIKAVESYDSK